MSRGAWVFIIGVFLLLFGGVLATVFLFSLASNLPFALDTVEPGQFLNSTVEMQPGQLLTYSVTIENFTEGDEVTVFIRFPSGNQTSPVRVTAGLVGASIPAERAGPHALIIQNTGPRGVIVRHVAAIIPPLASLLVFLGIVLAGIGVIVLIVGLILWALGRRRERTP